MSQDKINITFNNNTFKINLKIDDKLLKNISSLTNEHSDSNDNQMLCSFFKLLIDNPKAFFNNPEFKKEFNKVFTKIEKAALEAKKNTFKDNQDNDIQNQESNSSTTEQKTINLYDTEKKLKLESLDDDPLHFNIIANEDKCKQIEETTKLYTINDVKKLIDNNKYVLNDIYISELKRLYPDKINYNIKFESMYDKNNNKFIDAYNYFKTLSFCVDYGFGTNKINQTEFIGTLYKGINQPIYGFCTNIINTIVCTLMCYVNTYNNIRNIDINNIKNIFNINFNNIDDGFIINKEDIYFNYIIYILKSNCSIYCKHNLLLDNVYVNNKSVVNDNNKLLNENNKLFNNNINSLNEYINKLNEI